MQTLLPLLYFGGLAGSALTLRTLSRAEGGRRGYVYAAASSSMLAAVLVLGFTG
ncbi:hypothetical protein [Azospirillum sp.]|uniref:hypothetical protein n=1 Tax=Azospirillum sp. TaxID=34012 RepID=UPI003D7227C8